MRRPGRFILVWPAVLIVLLGVRPAGASPAWVREIQGMAAPPVPQGADAVVLLTRTEITVDAHLGVRRREYRALRILRPKGADRAHFEFQLEPGAKLERLRGWTIGPGREEETGSSDIAESTVDPEGYSDVRRVSLRARTPRAGDLVAVELAVTERLPFPGYTWIPQGPEALAVGRAELTLELPAGWEMAYHSRGPAKPTLASEGRRRELRLGPIAALPDERYAPPTRMIRPRVAIQMHGGAVESFGDWPSVSRWYAGLSAPAMATAAAAAELVEEARGLAPLERVALLAREVQHRVGYAAIELGAQRWVPDAAADTWKRRYGDCKDKSVLLASALHEAGIDARPALTCTEDGGPVDPEWPDPSSFNHCIVALAWPDGSPPPEAATVRGPSGRRWTLFDPTAQTPLGLLPSAIGGAWAVIADSAEGLVQLPPADRGRVRFDVQARLESDGVLAGRARIKAERAAVAWLDGLREAKSAARSHEAWSELLAPPGRRADIGAVRWLGTDSLNFTDSLEVEFKVTDVSRRAGASVLFPPLLPLGHHSPPPTDSSRILPVWLGSPLVVDDHIEIRLPPGMHLTDSPSHSTSSQAGAYRIEVAETDGALHVHRWFEVRETLVPPERWAEVANLMRETYRGDTAPWVLR